MPLTVETITFQLEALSDHPINPCLEPTVPLPNNGQVSECPWSKHYLFGETCFAFSWSTGSFLQHLPVPVKTTSPSLHLSCWQCAAFMSNPASNLDYLKEDFWNTWFWSWTTIEILAGISWDTQFAQQRSLCHKQASWSCVVQIQLEVFLEIGFSYQWSWFGLDVHFKSISWWVWNIGIRVILHRPSRSFLCIPKSVCYGLAKCCYTCLSFTPSSVQMPFYFFSPAGNKHRFPLPLRA